MISLFKLNFLFGTSQIFDLTMCLILFFRMKIPFNYFCNPRTLWVSFSLLVIGWDIACQG